MTDAFVEKVRTIGTIIKPSKERLPLGNKDRGRYVQSEKGRRDIFVPSYGVLEKEEVDYLVEAAQEQEDERIKKGIKSAQKEEIEMVATAMMKSPPGKRAEVGREIIRENRR